jgi:hypothetical protein
MKDSDIDLQMGHGGQTYRACLLTLYCLVIFVRLLRLCGEVWGVGIGRQLRLMALFGKVFI